MGSFWKNKSVLVTGGGGFIGLHLVERLLQGGAKVAVVDNLKRGNGENLKGVKDDIELIVADLLEPANCKIACRGREIVMHLAAKIRGVGYNLQHHAGMFYSNALMNLNMMEAARRM
jgi:nucleoside-diphosphate-sugar epimerase